MNTRTLIASHYPWIVSALIVSAVAVFAQSATPPASSPPAAEANPPGVEDRPTAAPAIGTPAFGAPAAERGAGVAPVAAPATAANRPVEAARSPNPYPYEPSPDKEDCAVCRSHLEKINQAIQAYRRDHKDLPNWLSDLYPDYLPDATVFICPVTAKTGRMSAFGALDPKIYCSYLYEFSPAPMWPPVKMSVREWKQQQMSVVGSDVPIVRCLLHEPAQNLSFGGRIYDSGLMWEENFVDVVRREDLNPHDRPVSTGSGTQPNIR